MRKDQALLFELGAPGRRGCSLPACDVPVKELDELLPPRLQRQLPLDLPELSEGEVVRITRPFPGAITGLIRAFIR